MITLDQLNEFTICRDKEEEEEEEEGEEEKILMAPMGFVPQGALKTMKKLFASLSDSVGFIPSFSTHSPPSSSSFSRSYASYSTEEPAPSPYPS
ncbi:hypothetical protein M0802_003000 [Mischocyttarus mexicanus]|nr:hypothetical protein M0802_003000 [Mischocyttarus mexicanus]